MRTSVGRGRIYRRCSCRDPQHHQLGAHCPHLTTDSQHGTWNFAVDVPTPGRHRTTVRRGGFRSQDAAEQALGRFLEGEAGGYNADPSQTVAAYLNAWLAAKTLVLKPTTMARYRDYVRNGLIPAFGTLKLDQLAHRHISAFVTCQLAAGRGRTTLHRCLATLSSALGDAVRQHRLPHNPSSPPVLRRPTAPERRIWTAEEAARFLTYCHQADPEMADLFEFLIGTGMRKGVADLLSRRAVDLRPQNPVWSRQRHNVCHWLRQTDARGAPYYRTLKPLLDTHAEQLAKAIDCA
ncbi:tyrosine-type recombinase/integrase [Streptomyces virginiae]|uniref:tyrosine-type recombinase/integrase n=1 Tax=Streptomyces virginiae TaxID=1961 RepID=UPI00368EFAF3